MRISNRTIRPYKASSTYDINEEDHDGSAFGYMLFRTALSNSELSRMTDISQASISRFRTGKAVPRLDVGLKLVDALCSVHPRPVGLADLWLLDERGVPKKDESLRATQS